MVENRCFKLLQLMYIEIYMETNYLIFHSNDIILCSHTIEVQLFKKIYFIKHFYASELD